MMGLYRIMAFNQKQSFFSLKKKELGASTITIFFSSSVHILESISKSYNYFVTIIYSILYSMD